jgi:hypothetical protein
MGFVFPASVLFSLVLIIASLSLFIVSKLKPNLYEESDNIYVVVGIVCGILLLGSLELNAAMAFQQLLLISATITLMWRFIQLRSENKQLKNNGRSGTDRSKSYNARLDDDYADTPRERRQSKRRKSVGYEEEDRRLLGDSIGSVVEPLLSRRRGRSFDADDGGDRYGEGRNSTANRQPDWDDDNDWNDRSNSRTPRRALPDADLQNRSAQRPSRNREDRSSTRDERDWNEFNETTTERDFDAPQDRPREREDLSESSTRRRRNRSTRSERSDREASSWENRDRQDDLDNRGAEGSMSGYVNYEPVDPPSGLPSSGSEPIVFPDRY